LAGRGGEVGEGRMPRCTGTVQYIDEVCDGREPREDEQKRWGAKRRSVRP
jgi:hypothetical protein